jgi:hypothetical protein
MFVGLGSCKLATVLNECLQMIQMLSKPQQPSIGYRQGTTKIASTMHTATKHSAQSRPNACMPGPICQILTHEFTQVTKLMTTQAYLLRSMTAPV